MPAGFEPTIARAGPTRATDIGRDDGGGHGTFTAPRSPIPDAVVRRSSSPTSDGPDQAHRSTSPASEIVIHAWPEDTRLARPHVSGDPQGQRCPTSRTDRPALAGARRPRRHARSHTPQHRGLRRVLRLERRPDRDQRGPRRPRSSSTRRRTPGSTATCSTDAGSTRASPTNTPRASSPPTGPGDARARGPSRRPTKAAFQLDDWPPPSRSTRRRDDAHEQLRLRRVLDGHPPDRRRGRRGQDARTCSRRPRPGPHRLPGAGAGRDAASARGGLAPLPRPRRGCGGSTTADRAVPRRGSSRTDGAAARDRPARHGPVALRRARSRWRRLAARIDHPRADERAGSSTTPRPRWPAARDRPRPIATRSTTSTTELGVSAHRRDRSSPPTRPRPRPATCPPWTRRIGDLDSPRHEAVAAGRDALAAARPPLVTARACSGSIPAGGAYDAAPGGVRGRR